MKSGQMATSRLTGRISARNLPEMIRLATPADAPGVHAIYAPVVRDTVVSFEWTPPSVAEMAARIEKITAVRPWLVYEPDKEVLGYVYASTFRDRAAYDWGPEVSVYVHPKAHRRGVARGLYTALFEVLKLQGYCTVVAGATVPNPPSEELHRSLGFGTIGRYPGAGFKFGGWHDVAFWFLRLRELPPEPPALASLRDVVATPQWNDALAHGASLIKAK